MEIHIPSFAFGTILFKYHYGWANPIENILYEDYATKAEIGYLYSKICLRVKFEQPQTMKKGYWEIPFINEESFIYKPYFTDYNIFKVAKNRFVIQGSIIDPYPYSTFKHAWSFIAQLRASSAIEKLEFWDVID